MRSVLVAHTNSVQASPRCLLLSLLSSFSPQVEGVQAGVPNGSSKPANARKESCHECPTLGMGYTTLIIAWYAHTCTHVQN